MSGENSPQFKVFPWATPSFFQGQYRREDRNSGGCHLGTGTKRLFWKILALVWAWKLLVFFMALVSWNCKRNKLDSIRFFSPPVSVKNLENNTCNKKQQQHDFPRSCSRLIRILCRRKSTLSVFELKVKRIVQNFSASNFACTDSKTQLFMMRPRGGSRKFWERWPGRLPAI